MLTITKNGKTKNVSESVFKSVFKDSGWSVVGEQSPTSAVSKKQKEETVETVEEVVEENVDENVENNNEDDDEIPDEAWDEVIAEEEVEKPISDMNHDELVVKAESLGIQTKGMNNKQLREAIKEKM